MINTHKCKYIQQLKNQNKDLAAELKLNDSVSSESTAKLTNQLDEVNKQLSANQLERQKLVNQVSLWKQNFLKIEVKVQENRNN